VACVHLKLAALYVTQKQGRLRYGVLRRARRGAVLRALCGSAHQRLAPAPGACLRPARARTSLRQF